MGVRISFPVKRTPISYETKETVDSQGKKRNLGNDTGDANPFEEVTERLFEQILNNRIWIQEAREKYQNLDIEHLRNKYPEWTEPKLMDLKAQFQTFDLNQDGLIDFQELCHVLEEIGDTSDEATRRQYFIELDEDGSGAVDFEEFLALIHKFNEAPKGDVRKGKKAGLALLTVQGSDNVRKIRRLSIVQQIDHGLF